MIKQMNHGAYKSAMKSKTIAQLRYIARDAYDAMVAMPNNPNAGYYADEVNYATAELAARGVK